MMNELVFSDLITELPDRLKRISDIVLQFELELDNSTFYSDNNELGKIINNKIEQHLEELKEQVNQCYEWIIEYNNNLNVLNKGLLTNEFSYITEFNEAKEIINNDFR